LGVGRQADNLSPKKKLLGNLNCGLGTEREVKNRADWEKSIQEAKIRIGRQCHRRRSRRRRRRRKRR
jgi:hypothetical protein